MKRWFDDVQRGPYPRLDAIDPDKALKPTWFVTLTDGRDPRDHESTAEGQELFLGSVYRFLGGLVRQPSEPGVVRKSVSHVLPLVSFGIPSIHNCKRLHAHVIIMSDRDTLRERHFQRFPTGVVKASMYKPDQNGFYYLLHDHLLSIPRTKPYCPRTGKCRRAGCKYHDVGFAPQIDLFPVVSSKQTTTRLRRVNNRYDRAVTYPVLATASSKDTRIGTGASSSTFTKEQN